MLRPLDWAKHWVPLRGLLHNGGVRTHGNMAGIQIVYYVRNTMNRDRPKQGILSWMLVNERSTKVIIR